MKPEHNLMIQLTPEERERLVRKAVAGGFKNLNDYIKSCLVEMRRDSIESERVRELRNDLKRLQSELRGFTNQSLEPVSGEGELGQQLDQQPVQLPDRQTDLNSILQSDLPPAPVAVPSVLGGGAISTQAIPSAMFRQQQQGLGRFGLANSYRPGAPGRPAVSPGQDKAPDQLERMATQAFSASPRMKTEPEQREVPIPEPAQGAGVFPSFPPSNDQPKRVEPEKPEEARAVAPVEIPPPPLAEPIVEEVLEPEPEVIYESEEELLEGLLDPELLATNKRPADFVPAPPPEPEPPRVDEEALRRAASPEMQQEITRTKALQSQFWDQPEGQAPSRPIFPLPPVTAAPEAPAPIAAPEPTRRQSRTREVELPVTQQENPAQTAGERRRAQRRRTREIATETQPAETPVNERRKGQRRTKEVAAKTQTLDPPKPPTPEPSKKPAGTGSASGSAIPPVRPQDKSAGLSGNPPPKKRRL